MIVEASVNPVDGGVHVRIDADMNTTIPSSVMHAIATISILCTALMFRGAAPPQQHAGAPTAVVDASPPSITKNGSALASPAALLTTQRGTLPIILSAPHGGSVRVPGSRDRTQGVTVRDDMTAEVALLVAQRLTTKLGAKPSFVIAQFSRKDVDANRAPDSNEAFENDAAKAQYEAYHAALRTLVDESRAAHPGADNHPRALLIDLHGQKREPDAIVRGTRDGKSVAHLIARAGEAAITGPESICGLLRTKGYRVLPEDDALPAPAVPGTPDATEPNQSPPATPPANPRHPLNETFFDGGYIIAHYGAQNLGGIDAIQLELGRMRSTDTLKLSRDLADAIAAFYEQSIKQGPLGKLAK